MFYVSWILQSAPELIQIISVLFIFALIAVPMLVFGIIDKKTEQIWMGTFFVIFLVVLSIIVFIKF